MALHHAPRKALIPVVTEQVFSIPGFGKMVVDAVFNRDYPVVQGVVLVTALLFILLNLVTLFCMS